MDVTMKKAATVATAAMAATEIPFAVGTVGSHSGTAVTVILVVGRHSASHDGILQHEWWPAVGRCNNALLQLWQGMTEMERFMQYRVASKT